MALFASANAAPIPAQRAGIGLRHPHLATVLETTPAVGFLEVHAENYMGGGRARRVLETLRARYPVALHGVGLSLGSIEGPDRQHLERLASLVEAIEPWAVSEHVSFSSADGLYLNDLLPLPYTEEALEALCRGVELVQTRLKRSLLMENPSRYVAYVEAALSEGEFLAELVRRTGCGLLLDLNNLYVSAYNLGFQASAEFARLPGSAVGELHLAGHTVKALKDGGEIRIDDHGSAVAEPVWRLYEQTIARIGARATLIEWDTRLPPLEDLVGEAAVADARAAKALREAGQHARPTRAVRA